MLSEVEGADGVEPVPDSMRLAVEEMTPEQRVQRFVQVWAELCRRRPRGESTTANGQLPYIRYVIGARWQRGVPIIREYRASFAADFFPCRFCGRWWA